MRKSVFLSIALLSLPATASFATETPRLAVAISLDQFRYDYLVRFRPYFGEKGFQLLLQNGADYQECRYQHAITKTAPGHATILSGVSADVHGIVGNDWLDRSTWQTMVSVQDPDSPLVGAAPGAVHSPGGFFELQSGRSPRNFLATTVGDQLKLRFGARSRVIAVSNKDRAAILLGGKLADAAYWVEKNRFVTSRYYMAELPAWVADFNAANPIDSYFGRTWDRLLPAAVYDAVQGPDDAPGETTLYGLARTLPKRIDGGHPEIRSEFYDAFDVSPFSTDVLGAFALAVLAHEKLGQHADTDLLCISFSQIDHVGHEFGPDSHEMMDSVLRLDRVLAALFAAIDRSVGLQHCVIVLTADHGAPPLPEKIQALQRGIRADRFHGAALDQAVSAALDRAFGPVPANDFWCTRDNFGYTFHPSALAAKHLTPAQAAVVAKAAILRSPEIATAYTADELAGDGTLRSGGQGETGVEPEGDTLLAMSRRSYFPGRSVDVAFILRPYLSDRTPFGVNHGTPWDFDTHVPLIWYGLGVTPGVHVEPVHVEDLAPTLSAVLQIPRPPEARGRRLF